MSKLQKLAADFGYEDADEMINDAMHDSIVPSICTNVGCDATYEYEPDQDKGWCEECGTNTVESCLSLAGIL